MADLGYFLAMFAIGFGIGTLYGRMKGMGVEDKLRMQIADLKAQARLSRVLADTDNKEQ